MVVQRRSIKLGEQVDLIHSGVQGVAGGYPPIFVSCQEVRLVFQPELGQWVLSNDGVMIRRLSILGPIDFNIFLVLGGKILLVSAKGFSRLWYQSYSLGHPRRISEANTHPHVSSDERIALVHNGVIENYLAIRKFLEEKATTFFN